MSGGAMFIEINVTLDIMRTNISKNNASRGGAIYAERDCDISIDQSKVFENHAESGGCLYEVNSAANLKDSEFSDNFSTQHGGCFYFDSSNAEFHNSNMSRNEAIKRGGAIHATNGTLLDLTRSTIDSNNASNGGGIALVSDSRIRCEECTFANNTSNIGSGVYIESHMQYVVIAQFYESIFRKNKALRHGGGMVIKTFGNRRYICEDMDEPCSRVVLIRTTFVANFANLSSPAILATKGNNVLVACQTWWDFYSSKFVEPYELLETTTSGSVKMLNDSKAPCQSWKYNLLANGEQGRVIGTFGQNINVTIDSMDGSQITGNSKLGFALHNVTSGKELPTIKITATDAFGNEHAPTLHSDALALSNHDGFLRQSIGLSFENDTCIMSNIVGLVEPRNYSLQLKPSHDDDILEETNLIIVVRNCTVNEVSNWEGKLCLECSEASYNFDLSREKGCTPCPENADCSTQYIKPNDGYWHKGPCHSKVKKCIVEKACKYPNRTKTITHFAQNYVECGFNKENLEDYGEIQCHNGYEGPLCGSCNKSYGRSSNLECLECGHVMSSVMRLLLIILCLLVTTTIAIKGTLPIASMRLPRTFALTVEHENGDTSSLEEGTSGQGGQTSQEGTSAPPMITNDEEPVSSNISSQLAHSITIAHCNLVETWKILLNFLQVTSTAATMDVKWTGKMLGFFEMVDLIGSATLNAISRPIDCLVVSFSIGARAIWRYLFSLLIPMMVIALLSIYWGYNKLVKQGADGSYFWRRLLLTTITVIYVTYFDITQVAMKVFNHVSVYDDTDPFSNSFTRYWIIDTSIECYKSTHVVLIGISLVVLVVVSIGFPIACSQALLRNRNEVTISNSRAHEVLGLLCGPFKNTFVYWECITMIKKALLSLIIVFSYSLGSQAQGLLIALVLVFFLALHSTCYPFKKEFNILNYYEIGSLMTSCITYTLVQLLNIERLSETERGLVSIATIVLNGGFVIFMVLTVGKNFVTFAKTSLKSRHIIGIYDEIGWFKTIKIYLSSWWFGRLSSTRN